MVKYIVAVSGGVDSVVLLDKLVGQYGSGLVVAHFDHGIRPNSADDARFVEALAAKYDVIYEQRREVLGEKASEALARERRYVFLRELAQKYQAQVVTAHHLDDVMETIAINLVRGTGWRGLAVFGPYIDVVRPQLDVTKHDIYHYALMHGLEWVEDATNQSDQYLRNRLRKAMGRLSPDKKRQLLKLWQKQLMLREEIESECATALSSSDEHSRYFFTYAGDDVALELLRTLTSFRLTRPQAKRVLYDIKTLPAGTTSDAGGGVSIRLTQTAFTIQTL